MSAVDPVSMNDSAAIRVKATVVRADASPQMAQVPSLAEPGAETHGTTAAQPPHDSSFAHRIRSYASAGATDREIADALEMNKSHLQKRFGQILRKARAERRIAIRGHQTKCATGGNGRMLIFLGKADLGQSDRKDEKAARRMESRTTPGRRLAFPRRAEPPLA